MNRKIILCVLALLVFCRPGDAGRVSAAAEPPAGEFPVIVSQPEIAGETPLPATADRPAVLKWEQRPGIRLALRFAEGQDAESLAVRWHARSRDGKTMSFEDVGRGSWAGNYWVWCIPSDVLPPGQYEVWFELEMDGRQAVTETRHVIVRYPPLIHAGYHEPRTFFLGKVIRDGRTAFRRVPNNPILDSPGVWGCDNASMFEKDGTLYFILGDPHIDVPTGHYISGALAFTDRLVPEKGIDLAHRRNWRTDPETGLARPIAVPSPGSSRANCTGGALLPHGEGERLWFAVYDYAVRGADGERHPTPYRNYTRIGLAYSDDGLRTPAVRPPGLVLWDRDDASGPMVPDPYLGYPMRVLKGHLYLMMPRRGAPPVLLRCRLEDLDELSLDHWHYLVGTDEKGTAAWSERGIARGQLSDRDLPGVDFGHDFPGIVNGLFWNPYLNRWIALPAMGDSIWEASHYWGPYRNLRSPGLFRLPRLGAGYNCFSHELLLGDNGEWVYTLRSQSYPRHYGVYLEKFRLKGMLTIRLSRKSGRAGDLVEIECRNTSGMPAEDAALPSVTVDGRPASFEARHGDSYRFTYRLTGRENEGRPGAVVVAATLDVGDSGRNYRLGRDVALVVNRRNEVRCRILSPADGAEVSGTVSLEVEAFYEGEVEDLGDGRPEVKIIKTELRVIDGEREIVEDADWHPPFVLRFDTSRYPDGPRLLKVVAYDVLDRRGEATLLLDLGNPPRPEAGGNLVLDGNMELSTCEAWEPVGGAAVSKVSDGTHRSGRASLRVRSEIPREPAGVRQVIRGLEGGERLRFSAWSRMRAYFTATLLWTVTDREGTVIARQECNSYEFFHRALIEFDNPAGNTELVLQCVFHDPRGVSVVSGQAADYLEATIDDVVLRTADWPVVEPPENVRAQALPPGDRVRLSWDAARNPDLAWYYICRRAEGEEDFRRIREVESFHSSWVDDSPGAGSAGNHAYRVTAVDRMAWESEAVTAVFAAGEEE